MGLWDNGWYLVIIKWGGADYRIIQNFLRQKFKILKDWWNLLFKINIYIYLGESITKNTKKIRKTLLYKKDNYLNNSNLS